MFVVWYTLCALCIIGALFTMLGAVAFAFDTDYEPKKRRHMRAWTLRATGILWLAAAFFYIAGRL